MTKSWELFGDAIDGDAARDFLGSSVSLSADGTVIAIGAPSADVNVKGTGKVKVYRIDSAGLSWKPLGKSIDGNNAGDNFGRLSSDHGFGKAVDISPDGSTIAIGFFRTFAIGSPWDGKSAIPGYVKVISLDGSDNIGTGNWTQVGEDITGEDDGDHFGYSVSLSYDGKTLAVGAWRHNVTIGYHNGHVRVYQMKDSELGWIKCGEDIDGNVSFGGW
ncbi:LOW QUALITY PROTEIN: hypothetical protein ACHAXA_011102 [Cyclostephanos tholiformis]|uniref:Uncharacterized protein n=1 Tax=Cyclostephanos tholiformis TaxID=382380 RepID=A0ABD3SFQ3_9STRA